MAEKRSRKSRRTKRTKTRKIKDTYYAGVSAPGEIWFPVPRGKLTKTQQEVSDRVERELKRKKRTRR